MDIILSNTKVGKFVDSRAIVELIARLSNYLAKLIVPNYTHFGEILYLDKNKVERKDFSFNFNLKKYIDSPDAFMNAIQNHYSGNYLRKIASLLSETNHTFVLSETNKPKTLNQLNSFNLPTELNEVEINEEDKKENIYSFEFVRTEFETDVFLNIRCLNFEYIVNGMLKVESSLFSSSNSAKKVIFQYENDNKKSLQLSFSVSNVELSRNDYKATFFLITHFEERYQLPVTIESKHFRKEKFSHKEILIEDMPVDLLYIYAMNYINIFRNINHERYKTNCEHLQKILNDICKIWKIDDKKNHEFSDEELKGVLFSYFMIDSSNLDLIEQRFKHTFVNFSDHFCDQDSKMFIQDVLPTCYYLKQKQSSLITWDNTRSFFLNMYNAITKIVIYAFEFKRITSDDGYLNTLKYIENVDFKGVLPYAGCYEEAIVKAVEGNQVKKSEIIESIILNRQLRTILKDGFIFGVIGKKKCGKSTFVEKMLPGVDANASALIGTVQTSVYLTKPDSYVFLEYAHFDSVDFSHKLQFIFSRKLLNFVFMVCNAMERMDSDDTMKLFKTIKGGHDCNFVILLNRADEILADCKNKEDFGRSTVDEFLRVVRDRWGLVAQEEKERVWLTCLKDIQDSGELDIVNNVGVLFGDNLKRNVFKKVNQITGRRVDEEVNVQVLPYKKITIQNEKGFKEFRLVITTDATQCPTDLVNIIDTDVKLQDEMALFKIGHSQPRFRLKYPSNTIDGNKVFSTIDELLKANGTLFIVYCRFIVLHLLKI